MLAESRRRDSEDEVQYLTAAQLDQVMEQNPESDIRDYEDLQSGGEGASSTTTVCYKRAGSSAMHHGSCCLARLHHFERTQESCSTVHLKQRKCNIA